VTVPPPGFGLTVPVSVTVVGVVASPWTLLLVKTRDVEPFGLPEMDVVVAVDADPVKEIDHDPSEPDGVNPEDDWFAMYSVQVPFITLLFVPNELNLKEPQVTPRGLQRLFPIPAEL
jgi:hypothetical protein